MNRKRYWLTLALMTVFSAAMGAGSTIAMGFPLNLSVALPIAFLLGFVPSLVASK